MANTVQYPDFNPVIREYYPELQLDNLKVEPAPGPNLNSSNYIISQSGMSHGKKYFLKTFHAKHLEKSKAQINAYHKCGQQNTPVALIAPNKDGIAFTHWKNNLISLFEYIKPASDTTINIREVASAFALLQMRLREQKMEIPRDSDSMLFNDHEFQRAESRLSNDSSSEFDTLVSRNLPDLKKWMTEYRTWYESSEGSYALGYVDLHPDNLIISEEGRYVIIDPGSIHTNRSALPLGFACHRMSNNTEELIEFLQHYLEIDNGLNKQNLQQLTGAFVHESLIRISTILRCHFFDANHEWNHELDNQIGQLRYALDNADAIDAFIHENS